LQIALEHIALAAQDEGLGTCWIGAFSQEEVKKILGVPDQYKVVALMPIGYPEDAPGPTSAGPTLIPSRFRETFINRIDLLVRTVI